MWPAQIRALITAQAPPGIYHATSSGETTWFGLARDVYARRRRGSGTGDPHHQLPPTRAPRGGPPIASLGHGGWLAAGIKPIGDWREALERALPAMLAAV